MQLASPAPIGVIVNVSTALAVPHPSTGLTRAEHLEVGFTSPDAPLDAYVQTYDQLWDGPVAQPAHPGDWRATRTSSASPAIRDAVRGLQSLVSSLDLTKLSNVTTSAPSYATMHLRYAERPTNLGSLRAYEDRDGSWVVMVRTSIEDLFADPTLLPVVDAARAVLTAAR